MDKEILDFIQNERIAVLGVENLDGSPHGATIHFASTTEPLSFIIMTGRDSKKCEGIIANGKCLASLVLGFSEEEMKTLQLEGTLEFNSDPLIEKVFFDKFPDKKQWYTPEKNVFLLFISTKGKYTDFKSKEGKKIITL